MVTYQVCDDIGSSVEIESTSAYEACLEFTQDYDVPRTCWCGVRATPIGPDGEPMDDQSETHTITIDPAEPECDGDHSHSWESPIKIVGGFKENPGVWGHGGGVIMDSVCRYCGWYRVTDTWAQNPSNGDQGLTSVEYREPDERSSEWVAGLSEEVDA